MGDYTPPGVSPDTWTQTAGAPITGGQILIQSGDNQVSPATAAALTVVGVAASDCPTGGRCTVYGLDSIHETVVAGATIAAGNPVMTGAAGTLTLDGAPAVLKTIGICIVGAAAAAKARWIGV